MDRKFCILLYSKYSQACIDLLKYIHSLPFDFPSVTGLSMMSVDNKKAKDVCYKNGIAGVPVLLVEYFFIENQNMGKKQMLEREQIYEWVDEMVKICIDSNGLKDLIKSDEGETSGASSFSAAKGAIRGFAGADGAKTSRGVTFLNSSNKSDVLPMMKIPVFDETYPEESEAVSESEKKKSLSKNRSAAAIAAEMEKQRKLEDEKFTKSIKSNKFSDSKS